MEIKRKIKILGSCVVTILLLALMLRYLDRLMERKDSRDKFEKFYEQKENFDVLFLGTSHVHNGISPMDLWEQNGIVSYNLSTPGCRIATAYWTLRIALEYTDPELVVLDCAYLKDEKANDNVNYGHRVFDAVPFGVLKAKAIMDLYDTGENRLRYLCPLSLYHNRWTELEEKDFSPGIVKGKMGFYGLETTGEVELPDFSVKELQPVDNVSTVYLEKIIEECNKNHIALLFTYLPFNADQVNQNDAAYIEKIAKENNIRYLTPGEIASVVNPETDFTNISENNAHLNFSGAHKVSYYIGNYIMKNYDIKDQRENPEYSAWDEYYHDYREYKLNFLKEAAELENYLMLSADKNYHSLIEIYNSDLWADRRFKQLLANLGVDLEKVSEKTDYLVIKQGGLEVEYYEGYFQEAKERNHDENIKIVTIDKNTEEIVNVAVY